MRASAHCLDLIKEFEGFPFGGRPYWDPWGKVWTQGYGDTGHGIGSGTPAVSQATALSRLKKRLAEEYEPALRAQPFAGELTQNMWDALVCAIYNLGPGVLGAGHDLGDALRRGDWRAAGDALLLYSFAGGVRLPGLVRRREAERALFLKAPRWLEGYRRDERAWIEEYDRLRTRPGTQAAERRKALRQLMISRRKEVWRIAQSRGWTPYRRARYKSLLARTT